MSTLKKVGVLTSGGDAPGMNACIRAVTRAAIYNGLQVFGIRYGFQGLIQGDIHQLFANSVSNIIQLGGTILKSARSAEFTTPEGRQKAYEQLQKAGIQALVVIGGDGSYRGAHEFITAYPDIQVIGLPGTIDNDLGGTDATIGFDTAINTAMRAIDNIRDTADAFNRLFFVEVMGRDSGFIALHVGLSSGAEAILVPEEKTNLEALIEILDTGWKRHKTSSIIVVAEGDDAGGAFEVAAKVKQRFSHYETKVAILGHIQRGGSPTCQDRVLATRLGAAAIESLLQGKTGIALGICHHQIRETELLAAAQTRESINPSLLRLVDILSV
ncbi:MAG: 6-phosphofructokinase [Bacteroidia bacterium]|nr:6-phosphofructokinase [Bacteroidia bacterium]MDW8158323.1 6-phosphofructokinase [Bacteroidia bacterium]